MASVSSVHADEATVVLSPRVPSGEVCDKEYFYVSKLRAPYVCKPKKEGEDESLIQFEGPSQVWKELPDIINMEYALSASQNGRQFHASGPFTVDVTVAATNPEETRENGRLSQNRDRSTSAKVVVDGQVKERSWGTVVVDTIKNDAGTLTCLLRYQAELGTLGAVSFRSLSLGLDIPLETKTEWEDMCGKPSQMKFQWIDGYYISGFRTYGNPSTILAVHSTNYVIMVHFLRISLEALSNPFGLVVAFALGMTFMGLLKRSKTLDDKL